MLNIPPPSPPFELVRRAVAHALAEDLGLAGDITSMATVAANAVARGALAARRPGTLAGLSLAREAFLQVDPRTEFAALVDDGAGIEAGQLVARLTGPARAILAAERVALNFVSRMSGIATLTRAYVDAVAGTNAAIIDTRKTTPGFRAFEKYAVLCGGGRNHRFGLFDAILIKDNHIAAAGGVAAAVMAAKAAVGHMVKVEVEVDTLNQLEEALEAGADIVMLDNFDTNAMRQAEALNAGRAVLEASGGVNLETVRAIAETGVDLISVGALTHSAPIVDFGLDFE